MAAKRRRKSPPRRPKESPDQIVIGLAFGFVLLFWHLGVAIFNALYYAIWFDPNDTRPTEAKPRERKLKRKGT